MKKSSKIICVFYTPLALNLILCYSVYRWEISHIIKREHSVFHVECLPNSWPMGTYSKTLILMNECHFFIKKKKKIIRNKMIETSFKNFIIKVFKVILSNLLSIRDLVDTQNWYSLFKLYNITISYTRECFVILLFVKFNLKIT